MLSEQHGGIENIIVIGYFWMAPKAEGVQGTVVLDAVINKEGRVVQLSVVSGIPALNDAAVSAVMRWTYKPFRLNGELTEAATMITVNFTLL
jgi:protein TonB